MGSPAWASGPEDATTGPATLAPLPRVESDWAGPYAGFNLGVAHLGAGAERGDFSGDLIELDVANGLFPDSIDDPRASGAGGFALGFSHQRGSFVGGVELDVSALDQRATADFSRIDPNPNPPFTGIDTNTFYTTEIGTLATLRMRAGYAYDRTLLFASAGIAAGEVENEFRLELPDLGYSSPGWHEDGTRWGWAVGVGVERKLTDRVSLKGEIMHYDLEDVVIDAADPVTFPGEEIGYRFDNAGTVFRIGINIAF